MRNALQFKGPADRFDLVCVSGKVASIFKCSTFECHAWPIGRLQAAKQIVKRLVNIIVWQTEILKS